MAGFLPHAHADGVFIAAKAVTSQFTWRLTWLSIIDYVAALFEPLTLVQKFASAI